MFLLAKIKIDLSVTSTNEAVSFSAVCPSVSSITTCSTDKGGTLNNDAD